MQMTEKGNSTTKNPQSKKSRRPIPTLVIVLALAIAFGLYIAIANQLNILSIDYENGVSINTDTLLQTILSTNTKDDDNYVKQFQTGNDAGAWKDDDKEKVDESESSKKFVDNVFSHGIDQNKEDQVKGEDEGFIGGGDKDDDNHKNDDTGDVDKDTDDASVSNVNNDNKLGTQRQPLNILLLYPDDWRHDTIGSEKPYVLTPFLDQLAREGIRFTHNAVTTSVCWMSRATLWMGQYSSRHKSYMLKCPRFGLPNNWVHSWVAMLQGAGYYAGHVGKWQYYTKDTKKYFDWSRFFEGHHWEKISGGRVVHASDLARDYAVQFLDERPKDKPFALSVAFYPPKPVGNGRAPGHQWSPTNETKKLYENVTIPRPEAKESFKKLPKFLHGGPAVGRFGQRYPDEEHFQASMRNYYALVTGVDQACKEIVDKLKEQGLYNNTMIIFTTDNGMFHGAHGLAGKWYPYQESIRVPLIIYDPRMPADKVGTLDDSFTLNVDLAETILGAAGIKPDDLMQGRDISDLYLPHNEKNEYHSSASVGSEPWRDEFFYEFPSPEMKFIPSSTALVRKEWKYIHWPEHDYEQLFNLKEDPLELNDVFSSEDVKSVLLNMRRRHDELKQELHDVSFADDREDCTKLQKDIWEGKFDS